MAVSQEEMLDTISQQRPLLLQHLLLAETLVVARLKRKPNSMLFWQVLATTRLA